MSEHQDSLDLMADNPPPFEADDGGPVIADRSDLDALIGQYADARVAREAADETVKELKAREEILERRLFDALEKMNLRSVNHARGRFSLNDLAWASILDEPAVRRWAETEMPEILLPNASRLAVIVREALRGERDAMPPGVEPRFSRKIAWRRG